MSITISAVKTAGPAATEPESWRVSTASGIALHLPPSMRSLTTYVMLEQECWFEPEMSLLPRLLRAGAHALDIGANHGLYTLEIARCAPGGRVWAFEPTSEPRARLRRSVEEAGLAGRVVVVDAALADSVGEASFAVHDNSELNSRTGEGGRRERVRLETLDGYLESHAPGLAIDFVKLDAEGDETRVLAGAQRFFAAQSPVVLFEYKHGAAVNDALLDAWQGLGYGLFRWSAELALLLPFDQATAEAAFALNLVGVRPAQQAALAARGLLVTAAAQASSGPTTVPPPPAMDAALQAWCARPSQHGLTPATATDQTYGTALRLVATAHLADGLDPAGRWAAMQGARDLAMAHHASSAPCSLELGVLLVHGLHALDEQLAAVELGSRLLKQWPQGGGDIRQPMVPPLLADLERARSTAAGSWLQQLLGEYVATFSAYSSYFQPPMPTRWAALLTHPDHGAGIERRYLLAHVLSDRVAPVEKLNLLTDPRQTCNHFLWDGLIWTMAAMVPVDPSAPLLGADDLLATLPVAALTVVDVGASSLGNETEPYASLVRAGRARVTGFEPDAAALSQLRQAFPDPATHAFLPHFVGDGGAATFHETEWSLTASLLTPNRTLLDRYHQLGELVRLKAQHAVQTVRLDDVIAPGGMDLLKIDVQGAECLVFDGAAERLAECLVVWTEVEMVPLYRGQPLFGDVDARLRKHGLQFLCFTGLATRSLASWPQGGLPAPRRAQQLWADAIYVPAPERIASLSADAAARLALLAHHVVDACDLCHAALLRFDELAHSDFAPRYLEALRAAR
jgi:FkbM family methyltransferase